jgi:hypothetical protein
VTRLSRRTVLAAAAVCAAAAAGAWRWLSASASGRAAPGAVSRATLDTLVAAAGTVIGKPIEPSHYAEYFRWRAEHLPDYRAVYEGFAAEADRDAQRAARCSFAACPAAVRGRLLAGSPRARRSGTLFDAIWMAAGGRRWVTYNTFIFDEALALFADTDAWTLAGYEGWPGTPRGLDRYSRAPN